MSGAGYRAFVLQDAPLDEGTVLLEASAGTGKTYTLTGVLVRMLLEGTVEHIEQALVVTFTVAAADELKNRLRAALQQALRVCQGERDTDPFFASLAAHGTRGAQRLRRALDEFDQASVMTIHGFCKRLLDEAAFESEEPFELEFTVDEAPLWHAAAADALRLLRRHDGPMLGAVLHHMALQPDALVSLYRGWQRHPNAALTPSEPQPAVHLANLCAAVHRAKSHWDEDLLDLLATFEWLANKGPTRGDVRDYFARQAEPLHDHPELCLGLFHQLSPSQLRGRLKRKSIGRTDRPFFQACEEVTNELRRVKDHVRSELLLHMHTRLERHKRDRALATFDDLLARSHAAVCDPRRREHLLASLRQRYRVALIDEFQDTDERQYAILANTFRNRPLFLIGDPKQSIYAFRGADLQTYLRAADDAVERRTLARNFRSSRNLVAAVHQLFAGPNAFVEPRIRMPRIEANAGPDDLLVDEGGPALRFRLLEYEIGNPDKAKSINPNDARTRIVRDVVAEIRRLLDGPVRLRDGDRSRAIAPRDIAVLTRRNDDAMLVQEHLRAASVVSVIGKAGDVFLTDELVELERVLHAVLRPNDLRRVRAAMATRLWGFDAADLVRMSREAERFEEPWAQIERWRQLWLHRGFVVMKEQLFQDLDVAGRLLARRDGERRLTNLRQLCEMLHQAEHQRRLSPEGLVHWLAHERNHSDGLDPQRRELRLESDEDAVQILTMHGSKGLQYEVVFCPFLWSGRPALRKNVAVTGGDGDPLARRFAYEVPADDPGWLRSEAERLAEDVRLSYVALTRARRRCYVHWGPIAHGNTGYHYSALAWLLPPNTQDVRTADWQRTWPANYRDRSARLAQDLEQLAAASKGAIGVEIVPRRQPTPGADQPTTTTDQAAAERTPPRLPARRPLAVHSFSSLVTGSVTTVLAREIDAPPEPPAPRAEPERATGEGIFGFARGADAGQCLHAVLEHVDFDALDADATRSVIERTLAEHRLLDRAAHPGDIDPIAVVRQNLRDLAAARVLANGPTVRELCTGSRQVEWKFTLPIAAPDLPALADRFAASSSDAASAYAQRLATLPTQRLAGFLTGFADLIAAHQGRFWIVDWKSNHLGDAPSQYAEEALRTAMDEHDYVLQYHLYVLALHRHLRCRLPDYDYERHFGGVSYAFLRGAVPDTTIGMFYDRPPRELVEELDAWATKNR